MPMLRLCVRSRRHCGIGLLVAPCSVHGQSLQRIPGASPERCSIVGAERRCEANFGAGTIVMFGDSGGDVHRLVIVAPDTRADPAGLLAFVGTIWLLLSPSVDTEGRAQAFKKLMVIGATHNNEWIRLA